MNIVRCPPEALNADFGDIIIDNVAGKLDFKVSLGGAEVLLESYYPDNAGTVYIRDLALLADAYRQENNLLADATSFNGTVTFNLQFKEGIQTLNRTVKLYACEFETAGTLTPALLKNIPLTRCFNKTVAPEQTEYISFYGAGAVTMQVVYTGTGSDLSQMIAFATLPDNADLVSRLDVSPAVVAQRAGIDPARIVYYMLYKDQSARIKYNMITFLRPGTSFLFVNAFGAQETFTCYGDTERERKWTRELGQINRLQHMIYREAADTRSVNTGYLTREQTETVEDLLNARQIVLIDRYGSHPIVIAEETFKVKSRPDELIDVEFKYRPAGNRTQYRFNPSRYRIFDKSFDETYN